MGGAIVSAVCAILGAGLACFLHVLASKGVASSRRQHDRTAEKHLRKGIASADGSGLSMRGDAQLIFSVALLVEHVLMSIFVALSLIVISSADIEYMYYLEEAASPLIDFVVRNYGALDLFFSQAEEEKYFDRIVFVRVIFVSQVLILAYIFTKFLIIIFVHAGHSTEYCRRYIEVIDLNLARKARTLAVGCLVMAGIGFQISMLLSSSYLVAGKASVVDYNSWAGIVHTIGIFVFIMMFTIFGSISTFSYGVYLYMRREFKRGMK